MREYITVEKSALFEQITAMRNAGFTLSQILATRADDILYALEKDGDLRVLRVNLPIGEPLESVTALYPYAYLYENEMRELFGVNVVNINVDFAGNLYKTAEKTPFAPKEVTP